MKTQLKRYDSVAAFGRSLGLSNVDIELIRQKKKLIEKLKKARIKKRLSQAQLAARIGSKQPAIARMESGQVSEVSMDFLMKIAFVMGVPVAIHSSVTNAA